MLTGARPSSIGAAAFVLTVLGAAFLWVWIGQWSLPPDKYPDASTWWREFALPRAAQGLLLGLPLGAVVAGLAYRLTKRPPL